MASWCSLHNIFYNFQKYWNRRGGICVVLIVKYNSNPYNVCVCIIMIWIKRVVAAEGRLCCNDERGSPRKKMHASITIIFRTSLKFKMAVSSASSRIYQQLYNYYLLSKSNSKFLAVWLAGRNACGVWAFASYIFCVEFHINGTYQMCYKQKVQR